MFISTYDIDPKNKYTYVLYIISMTSIPKRTKHYYSVLDKQKAIQLPSSGIRVNKQIEIKNYQIIIYSSEKNPILNQDIKLTDDYN